MNNELVVFSHNDLDALGCVLNIEHKFERASKKYFHTNYANIPEIVNEILVHQIKTGSTHMIITDVSFSDNKKYLKILYDAFEHITYIDHHLYPDDFWNEFPNMKIKWDKSKCAALLCYEYFNNNNHSLHKLSKLIDVYDIWRTEHPAFPVSQDLNEYFWSKNRTSGISIEELSKEIKIVQYNLPRDYLEVVQGIKDTYNPIIEKYYSEKQIQTSGNITLCFINDWFNQVLIPEMQRGQDFVIGFNSYGIIRVRIRAQAEYTKEQKDELRLKLTKTSNTGHNNAFTYKIDNPVSFDKLIAEAKKIVNIIQQFKK